MNLGRPGMLMADVFWAASGSGFSRNSEVMVELLDSTGTGPGPAAKHFRTPWLGIGANRTAWQARVNGRYYAALLAHQHPMAEKDKNVRQVLTNILADDDLRSRVIAHHAQLHGTLDQVPMSIWLTDLAAMDLAHWRSLDPEPFTIERAGQLWAVQGPSRGLGLGAQSVHYLRPVAELLHALHAQQQDDVYRYDVIWRDIALENIALRLADGTEMPTAVLDPEAGRLIDVRMDATITGTHFHADIASPADIELLQLRRIRRDPGSDEVKAAYLAALDHANEVFHFGRILQQLAFEIGDRDPGRIVLGTDPTGATDRVYDLAISCVRLDPATRPPLSEIVEELKNIGALVPYVPVIVPARIARRATKRDERKHFPPARGVALPPRVQSGAPIAAAQTESSAAAPAPAGASPAQTEGDSAKPAIGPEVSTDVHNDNQRPARRPRLVLVATLIALVLSAAALTMSGSGVLTRLTGGFFGPHTSSPSTSQTTTPTTSASSTAPTSPTNTPSTDSSSSSSSSSPVAPPADPAITWSLKTVSVTAGARATFEFATTNLGDASLVLQRQVGTAGEWTTVSTINGTHGASSTPPVPMGVQIYRVAAVDRASSVIASGAAGEVHSFGEVSLGELTGNTSPEKSIVIGQQSFRYRAITELDALNYDRKGQTLLRADSSTCRRITLDIGSSLQYQNEAPDTVTIVQEALDPVSVTIEPGTIGTLTANLKPGQSFAVTMAGDHYAYINGHASCFDDSSDVKMVGVA